MVDIIIIIFIIIGIFVGAKRGFTTELLSFLGFILCIIFAFFAKNPISAFFYDKLPFFTFAGVFKGITALNILLYEVIAFLISFVIASIILRLLKFVTRVFESFLKETIILGIPSKILGGILGGIEWVILSTIIIFLLSLPIINTPFPIESKIYNYTISLSGNFSKEIDNLIAVIDEFESIKDKYKSEEDTNSFNLETLDILLKYNIIDVSSCDKLYQKGKFKAISNVESVLDKYR